MLSEMQKALIKARAVELLTETCTIEVQDSSTGSMGEPTNSWSVVASGVACRVIGAGTSNTSAAAAVGGQEAIQEIYRLICPAGTALAVNQRVTVGGIVYHVTRLVTDRTDETDTQAILERARTA